MKDYIWLSAPSLSGQEESYIKEALEANWIAPIGPQIDAFEEDIKAIIGGNNFVTALNSGTSAIHLALKLIGVTSQDVVLSQSKTFIASVNPILYQNAEPVFIDSEIDTWNMCPNLLEKAIKDSLKKGKKPKAIIVISLYGMPFRAKEICSIGKHYNIPIIEDSAEAFGSHINNTHCGTFGDYGIFSFNGNKIITTSAGGALITKTKLEKERAIYLSTQSKESGIEYVHSEIGYNYRMSNICAAIGRGQLQNFAQRVAKKRQIYDFYVKELSYIDRISFLNEPKGYNSNRWLTCIKLKTQKERNEILNKLLEKNIGARPSWLPMHKQPSLRDAKKYLNGVADDLSNTVLCLPSGIGLKQKELELISKTIKTYF